MESNYFTILYWFCHTSTWIHHGCSRIPYPATPSHFPHYTILIPSVYFPPYIIPLHQPQASCILHGTWTGDSFFIWYYTCFWRRQWHPTPVLLPGKSHGRRSLVGCSPWGRKELDTTEWLHFHSSLSCVGEGNGNPLQCSCLENLRDGGAWWAAVYGVLQSQTWLKRLNSSSSSILVLMPFSQSIPPSPSPTES